MTLLLVALGIYKSVRIEHNWLLLKWRRAYAEAQIYQRSGDHKPTWEDSLQIQKGMQLYLNKEKEKKWSNQRPTGPNKHPRQPKEHK